jgi:hypothetical protein
MALGMEKFNCDMFQITVEFDEKQFNTKAFMSDVKADKDERFFVYHFGAKNKRIKDHAHLVVDLDGKESSVKLTFHKGKGKITDACAPYVEDFAQWLGSFFKKKSVTADITAMYVYPTDSFTSTIAFGFPILINDKMLQDVTVSGYELNFPEKTGIRKMIVSEKEAHVFTFISASVTTDLTTFEIYDEIRRFESYTQPFVDKETNSGKQRRKVSRQS